MTRTKPSPALSKAAPRIELSLLAALFVQSIFNTVAIIALTPPGAPVSSTALLSGAGAFLPFVWAKWACRLARIYRATDRRGAR